MKTIKKAIPTLNLDLESKEIKIETFYNLRKFIDRLLLITEDLTQFYPPSGRSTLG